MQAVFWVKRGSVVCSVHCATQDAGSAGQGIAARCWQYAAQTVGAAVVPPIGRLPPVEVDPPVDKLPPAAGGGGGGVVPWQAPMVRQIP